MNNIICINFVVIVFFLSTSKSEHAYFNPYNCTNVPRGLVYVCGTDGKTYDNRFFLRCAQHEEYGQRINLQESHAWICFIWEEYGISTSTLLLIILALVILAVCLCIYRKKRTSRKKEESNRNVDLEQINVNAELNV